MPTQLFRSKNGSFSTSYRAISIRGRYKGPWRATRSEALKDAIAYRSTHQYAVEIEVRQSQRMRFTVK